MKKMFLLIVAMIFAVTSVNSPAVAGEGCGGSGTKGALVGGAVGGLLGHSLGGKNKLAGTVLGALGGAIVGSVIAKKLDECEKQKMAKANVDAANAPVGESQNWTSDTRSDVHGTVSAAAPEKLADGRQCRTVTNVAYISGQEVRETPRLCRTPPATEWKVA